VSTQLLFQEMHLIVVAVTERQHRALAAGLAMALQPDALPDPRFLTGPVNMGKGPIRLPVQGVICLQPEILHTDGQTE